MKAKEMIVGQKYTAKINNKIVPCKLLAITTQYNGRASYRVLNLVTNRETVFRSAAKFREKLTE